MNSQAALSNYFTKFRESSLVVSEEFITQPYNIVVILDNVGLYKWIYGSNFCQYTISRCRIRSGQLR